MQSFHKLLIMLVSIIILFGSSAAQNRQVVAEFGKYSIYLDEFEKAYAKNSGGFEEAKNDSLDNYKNFLDLYVNFRMKLRDAQVRAYDRDEDLIREFDSYRKQVGASYIIEKEIIEPNLMKFYEDQKYEVRISHIMIRPDENLTVAKKTAEQVIKLLNEGGDFTELAREYSDDQYTKISGGDIYWFTSGQIIPEFENVISGMKVGEVYPEPVQTRYGFHIIKVTAKQKRRYQLRARHILASLDANESDSAAKAKITEVLSKLNQGEDFGELAKTYSDDLGTGSKGGDLGFFSRRMMVMPFDEAVFKLKVGERSGIIKTRFGYHIIELVEEKPFPEIEKMGEKLKEQYKKMRYDADLEKYTEDLKVKYNFVKNDNLINEIPNYKDTIRFDESYRDSQFRNAYKDQVIMSVNSNDVNVDSLFSFSISESEVAGKVLNRSNVLSDAVNLLGKKLVFDEAALDLEKTNEEFAALMNDYKNGIYIFRLQEEEVWDRIKIDSNEVKNYYENNKSNYVFPDRVDFSEILMHRDSVAKDLYSQLSGGADFDSLAKKFTRRPSFKSKNGHHGIQEVSGNVLAEKAYSLNNKGDISEPFKSGASWSIVRLNEKHPSRMKTFEEARAEAASDYQEKLVKDYEKEYINRLTELYKPKYHYEVLKFAFNENIN